MIKRYRPSGGAIFLDTLVYSNNITADGTSTRTYHTVIHGEPGSVVTFKVTSYTASNGGASYQVDSVTKVLNNTFTRTLDGMGQVSFDQAIDVGTTTPGNGIDVILTIMSTTIGAVSSTQFDTNISKTT